MSGLLQITTVYGDRCYVKAADYEKGRPAIRLVTRQGVYFEDRKSHKPGDCAHLARANVASVKPVAVKAAKGGAA
jgi:hypothetical protein